MDDNEPVVKVERLFVPDFVAEKMKHLKTVMPRFGQTMSMDHRGIIW